MAIMLEDYTSGPYTINDLQGMIQRQDADKIAENQSPFLQNISLDKPGTWSKRKGSDLLATTQAGAGVYGLINYAKNDGTNTLRAVRTRDLDAYNEATDTWTAIDATQFTAATKISSVVFNDNVYHISPQDYLCYETGSTCTEVGAGEDRIKANQVMVAQNTLFVCGRVSYQDRVYFSVFDSDANQLSDQLWTDDEARLADSSQYFRLNKPHVGSMAFNGLSYHFTKSSCYEWNLISYSLREVFNIGLAGQRAVTVCNGWLIWMAPDKRIFAWGGAGQPMDLSWPLEDDENGEAFINAIDEDNLEFVAAGSIGNKFYFSVGNVTTFGETLTNAVLKGLVTQKMDNVLFSIDTYPVKPVIFANAVLANKEVLLFGADGVDDIYQMNTGINDGSTAITAKAKTAFIDFNKPFYEKSLNSIEIKYRPQATVNTNLKVRFAKDGNYTYTTLSDADGGTTTYGSLDMYSANASTKLSDMKKLNFQPQTKGRSFSIEFSNNQTGEDFEVSSFAFDVGAMSPVDINITTD
jgi:hypothetical protein